MENVLTAIEDVLPDNLSRQKIKSVSCIKLFYISDRRNAWHGTEVRRWYTKSFHLSFDSASRYAERLRTNGSVFYIREIPAICIEASKSCAIITEVNTLEPFKWFAYLTDKDAVIKTFLDSGYELFDSILQPPSVVKLQILKNIKKLVLRPGNSFSDVVDSFDPNSLFWKNGIHYRKNLVRLLLQNPDISVLDKVSSESFFRASMSKAVGSNYRLRWNSMTTLVSAKSIFNLLKKSNVICGAKS